MRTNRESFEQSGPMPAGMELPILINRWIVAFNAHDVDELVALYHAEAELFDTGMRHARRGHQEIARWFSQRFASMPTIQYTPTRRFFGDGQAAVCWIASGTTPRLLGQSWLSRPFQVDGVSIFTVRNGLILRQSDYYDHFSIVEQIFPPLRWLPFRL